VCRHPEKCPDEPRALGLAARPELRADRSSPRTEDHFVGTEEMQRRAAARAGARIEVLEGLGHWWMVQDPRRGAECSLGSGHPCLTDPEPAVSVSGPHS
jgi:hypothetical protein